jgi:hypothetical protein
MQRYTFPAKKPDFPSTNAGVNRQAGGVSFSKIRSWTLRVADFDLRSGQEMI